MDTSMLAARLSKHHNRYAIYHLLGKTAKFTTLKGREHSGTAQRVCRNVFDNAVEMTIGGRMFKFKEPTIMAMDGEAIVFVYGEARKSNQSDKALFAELNRTVYRDETINDVITRTQFVQPKVMRFEVVA